MLAASCDGFCWTAWWYVTPWTRPPAWHVCRSHIEVPRPRCVSLAPPAARQISAKLGRTITAPIAFCHRTHQAVLQWSPAHQLRTGWPLMVRSTDARRPRHRRASSKTPISSLTLGDLKNLAFCVWPTKAARRPKKWYGEKNWALCHRSDDDLWPLHGERLDEVNFWTQPTDFWLSRASPLTLLPATETVPLLGH